MMTKIFVDITELVTWQGKLTGVPRVMDELSRRLRLQENVHLVQWTPSGYVHADYPGERAAVDVKPEPGTGLYVRAAKRIVNKFPRVKRLALRARKSLSRISQSQTKAPQASYVEVEKGEVLLVLADWHGSDPSFVQYLVQARARGVRLVQVVCDMLPVVTPQYSGHATQMLDNYGRQVYPLCDQLLAISENTKRDVQKWLKSNGLAVPVITTFRLGDDFTISEPRQPREDFFVDSKRKFALCVGTVEIRKNHQLLYYTYKLAAHRNIELPSLVIVGRRGWMTEQTYELMTKDPEVKDKFVFLHDASDEELSWLYDHCLFTVYPSFYEGWGLPVAESTVRGVVCAASNASSIPEVTGDLAVYFDPSSPEECLQRMAELSDKKKRDALKRRLGEYKLTSWDDTYEQVRAAITK